MIMVSRFPTGCCLRYTTTSMIRKRFNGSLTLRSARHASVLENHKGSRLMETTNTKSLCSGTKTSVGSAKMLVAAANKLTNQMAKLTPFKQFNQNGVSLGISCCRVTELHKSVIPWALELTRTNMHDFYEESEWGWSEKAKLSELTHKNAWYLLVRDVEGKAVAFVHFRFDLDYGTEVLYCYEIQLENSIRRLGLGQYLMLILELIAMQNRMQKVMLTVFKHNVAGRNFFSKKLRYEIDASSPKSRNTTYEILSKKISQPTEIIPKDSFSRSPKMLKTSHPDNNAITIGKKSQSEENVNIYLASDREFIHRNPGRMTGKCTSGENLDSEKLAAVKIQSDALENCQGDAFSPRLEKETSERERGESTQINRECAHIEDKSKQICQERLLNQKSANTECKVDPRQKSESPQSGC